MALKFSVVKPLQPLNARSPMEVTLLPMVTEVKPLQPLNACSPIEVTLFGMVTEVKLLQPLNALPPMEVTLYVVPLYLTVDGITTSPLT